MKKILLMSLLASALGSSVLAQTTVFSDDFNDNNRNGWYIFNAGDPAERSLDASGGNMETVSGSFATWGALSNFSSVTLANQGDYIKLSLAYTVVEDIGSRNATFGLYDSKGTKITADQSDLTNVTDEVGYSSYLQSDEIRTLAKPFGLGDLNGQSPNFKNTYANNPLALVGSYTYSLNLEVDVSNNIVITQIYNEGLANELIQTGTGLGGVNYFTFDTVAVQAVTQDFSIDNVLVTTNVIPEPSSILMMVIALGTAGLFAFRKKRG